MDALWRWTGGWLPTEKKTSVIHQLTLMTVLLSVYSDSLKCSLLDFEYVLQEAEMPHLFLFDVVSVL